MKRAPVISKPSPATSSPSRAAASAVPMVDSLAARVGAMTKGNTITLPVCGREVKFVLETVPANDIEKNTQVWSGNERVQEFLNEDSLNDLIPSFRLSGQQTPAFGRKINELIEVADGSRRRKASILTLNDYRILVGDLDDEQMDALCRLGNDYRPTSAYERGKRYSFRLYNEFKGNISALAEAEMISRKVITRCINTSSLPPKVISLFSHPGELSARAGEELNKIFRGHETLLHEKADELAARRQNGILLETDKIISELKLAFNKVSNSTRPVTTKRNFRTGASAQYKGNKVIFNLDTTKVPQDLIAQIEELLQSYRPKSY